MRPKFRKAFPDAPTATEPTFAQEADPSAQLALGASSGLLMSFAGRPLSEQY